MGQASAPFFPFPMRHTLAAFSVLSLSLGLFACRTGAAEPPAHAGPYLPDAAATQRMVQWRSLKYGMFIHYGMSTFTGRELDRGDRPSATFAPPRSDTDQWARVAHEAGMKYAVLTSKHVAGHCLWDSKVRYRGKEFDYDVATSGNGQDVVASFAKSCKKYDVVPGLYYCLLDSHNNGGAGRMPDEYFQFVKDQLAELAENYPEIRYYWIDIPRTATGAQRAALYDMLRTRRPECVVLFNFSGFWGKNSDLTIAAAHQAAWPTDVLNSERHIITPPFTPRQTFEGKPYFVGYEHCDCLGRNWFWTADDQMRPANLFIRMYDSVVNRRGGNLLLDVGPGQDGRISPDRVERLMEIKKGIDHLPPKGASPPISQGKPSRASGEWDGEHSAAKAFDGDSDTRWSAASGQASATLEVDLGKPVEIARAVIDEASYPQATKFAIEAQQADGSWTAVAGGEAIGAGMELKFAPVKAQKFRLHILESKLIHPGAGVTVDEFQLFEK